MFVNNEEYLGLKYRVEKLEKLLCPISGGGHGVWVSEDNGSHFCSECGHTALWKNSGSMIKEYCSDICPYCGALMTCDTEDDRSV